MARPGFLTHPKFRRLCHILREPAPHVLGYLEMMWSVGYENGTPYLGDKTDVELACHWPGEHGELHSALLACNLIDDLGDGTYQTHDLVDNAPAYVRNRMRMREQRERERQAPEPVAKQKPAQVQPLETQGKDLFGAVQPCATQPNTKDALCATSMPPSVKTKEVQFQIPPELDVPTFREVWASWLRHRKQKHNSVTEEGARRQFKDMVKMGVERAVAAINYSIKQGWTGLYEEKADGRPRSGEGVGSSVRVGTADDKIRGVEARSIRSGKAPDEQGAVDMSHAHDGKVGRSDRSDT